MTDQIQREKDMIIPWIFHRNGNEIRSFNKEWYAALKDHDEKAKDGLIFKGKKRHDFRSSAARRLYREYGFLPHEICRMVGWNSEEMFHYYCIVAEEDLQETARRSYEVIRSESK